MSEVAISQHLDSVGDGSGTKQFIGDYLTTSIITARIQPAEGSSYELHRIFINISDGGSVQTDTYGALAALTAGITMFVADASGTKFHLCDPDFPIKTNSGWAEICFDLEYVTLGGGNTHVHARLSFDKFTKQGILLDGDKGDYFGVTINDTLTGLTEHNFHIQGHVTRGPLNGALS